MDEIAARRAFDNAIATYEQDFGKFFLTRLFGMDISMGHLLYKRNGPGATLELKVQYLKVAKSGRLTCIGRFLRHGRSVSHLRSELLDENNELVAFATSTWKSL